jgi:hypothetical protein
MGLVIKSGRCTSMDMELNTSTKPSGSMGGYGVWFGAGSTPPTEDDYKLESPYVSGLSVVNQTGLDIVQDDDGVYACYACYAVTNTTEAEITIREIGAFGELVTYSSSKYYSKYRLLYERTVLANPITIPPGGSKLVTYKITINHSS